MDYLNVLGINAKIAATKIRKLTAKDKNKILQMMTDAIEQHKKEILEKNKIDLENAITNNIKDSFIDRLTLNDSRLDDLKNSFMQLIVLKDPIGDIISMHTLENGLTVGNKRTSLGVIGMIYEARPNVTAEAFALCLKTSNCVILRGGKEAINTNKILVNIFRNVLKQNNYDENFVQLIDNTDREITLKFMKLNKYVDVLIPRGGASLIKNVVENSTIPIIETGLGNCHIFVDKTADFNIAENIIINAKVQRPGVCNACESVLVHEEISKEFMPIIIKKLHKNNVEVRGCESTRNICNNIILATNEDYATEFNDLIIAIKIVKNIDEAITHIESFGTGHSEAIITESYKNSMKFLDEVDSAAVYVNASTRFTDGFEFGFGAEIGISTQKLHVRGPMGLLALTTSKYVIFGNGQIRE